MIVNMETDNSNLHLEVKSSFEELINQINNLNQSILEQQVEIEKLFKAKRSKIRKDKIKKIMDL